MDQPVEILLVEDNPGDVRLLQEAFKECQLPHRLQVVSDGGKALACLQRLAADARAVRPDLMVLELNLPCKNGWEVLAGLKEIPALHSLPVILLSAGLTARDEEQRAALRPNLYLQKPVTWEAYFRMAQAIGEFWSAFSRLHFHSTLSAA
ncbi:MAG TPA: response regulator [Candidatus Binatia bacterium]|jgi:CheY-like chemotaxis protein|nr:response regulator [Candidatus Binatia bacterium]